MSVQWMLRATLVVVLLVGAMEWMVHWQVPRTWRVLIAVALGWIVSLFLVRRWLSPMRSLFRALAGTVSSYRDHDYGFSLKSPGPNELGELVHAHNQLGDTLREQSLALVQRELLLDAMVQHSPVAMLLTQESGHIVFANVLARRMLWQGRKLEGHALADVLANAESGLRDAMLQDADSLFSVGQDEHEEVFHLSRRRFVLNGRRHQLLSIRSMTQELRRQEVQTWKKVIRVISHELNNSLAPIASLAHSGAQWLQRGRHDTLPEILHTIEDRSRHLEEFIRGYARFAKLPNPVREAIAWPALLNGLHTHFRYGRAGPLPEKPLFADPAQIEQALLNLLKNAHESGGDPEAVQIQIRAGNDSVRIDVLDRGPGMSPQVLSQALVPFYSTKRSGTGLGLALTREIIEAHGGRIALANREDGGLMVSVFLPLNDVL